MQRFLIIILGLILWVTDVSAQQYRISAYVSTNFSCPKTSDKDYKMGTGYSLGGCFTQSISRYYLLDIGLEMYYNTWEYRDFYVSENNDKIDNSFRNIGFAIPTTLGYLIRINNQSTIKVFFGPQFNVGIKNTLHLNNGTIDGDEDIDMYGETNAFKRFDCLLKTGATLSYKRFFIELNGKLGLVNQNKNTTYTKNCYQRGISLGIGYYLR